MVRANILVIGSSSFSDAAAYLNENKIYYTSILNNYEEAKLLNWQKIN